MDQSESLSLGTPEADARMAEDWKAIVAKHQVDDEPAPAKETPEVTDDADKQGKARDEKGKFAKSDKDARAEKVEKTAEDAPAEPQEAAPAAQENTEGRDLNRAPSSWKPAAKAAYNALAPEIKAEIHRRESDFMKGQSGLLPDAQFGKTIRQVAEPYRMLIESEGGTVEKAFSDLLRTAALFRTGTQQQKQQALTQIAHQYGIPMPQAQIGSDGPQAVGQQVEDPRVTALLHRMEAELRQREQVESSRRTAAADRWMNEVDAKGQPLRPYVDNVIDDMVPLVAQIRTKEPAMSETEIFQKAYEAATWANPEIRALMVKQQQDELEAKRREETLRKANEAKKAASVNVPRRAVGRTQAAKSSMEETIRETARTLGMIS